MSGRTRSSIRRFDWLPNHSERNISLRVGEFGMRKKGDHVGEL